MIPDELASDRRRRTVWRWLPLLIPLAYVATGWLGLRFSQVGASVTLIWPPSGIALAGLLLGGVRLWPAVFVGAFLVNLANDSPVGLAAAIAAGNTLEAVAGTLLLERFGLSFRLERFRDVVAFGLLGAVTAPLVAATLGAGSLLAWRTLSLDEAGRAWIAWWLGDAGGAWVVGTTILTWSSIDRSRVPWRRIAEGGLIAAGILAAGLLAWTPVLGPIHPSLAVAPFPFVTWAALRFGPRGAAAATLGTAVLAVAVTAVGTGPFAGPSDPTAMALLWTFTAIVGVTSILAGGLAEADREAGRLRARQLEREREVVAATARAKADLVRNVSHELRTPMHGILGSLGQLRRESLPAPVHSWVEIVDRSARQLSQIIDELLDSTAGEADLPLPAEEPGPGRLPGRGRRVLLVDDNEVNRVIAVAILRSAEFHVVEAESGAGALAWLEGETFAAMLLDCQMPEMDGYETVRRLRAKEEGAEGERLPVLALTAHAGTEERQKCLDAGMDDHLAKPFRPEELLALLARHLPPPL